MILSAAQRRHSAAMALFLRATTDGEANAAAAALLRMEDHHSVPRHLHIAVNVAVDAAARGVSERRYMAKIRRCGADLPAARWLWWTAAQFLA